MFLYRITFLGGSQDLMFADSPREAWQLATKKFTGMEVSAVKCVNAKRK